MGKNIKTKLEEHEVEAPAEVYVPAKEDVDTLVKNIKAHGHTVARELVEKKFWHYMDWLKSFNDTELKKLQDEARWIEEQMERKAV